ncbi:MAG: glycosyltransferase family 9 protein [Chlorobiales bacterium]
MFSILKYLYAAQIPKTIQRILVIREAAIGDVLCMTPFLKSLREMYPQATIDYVVVDWAKKVLENNPNINHIFSVSHDLISGKSWHIAFKRFQFFRNLSRKSYDIVFCPTTQLIYKVALLAFRTSYKIGFSTEAKPKLTKHNFMLNDYVHIDLNEIPRTRHIAVRNLEMLDLLSNKLIGRDYSLEIFPSDADIKKVDDWILKMGWIDKDIITIAPSTGNAAKSDSKFKTVPKEIFISIINQLKINSNRHFVFIGASSEYDYVSSLNIDDGKIVVNCCGQFTLTESAVMLKRSKLLLSCDSGATHLASAMKTNHIVLFGGTDDVEFGPYQNPNATVYRVSLPCAPCRAHSCLVEPSEQMRAYPRPYCLTMIDAQNVVHLAEKKLEHSRYHPQLFQPI